MAKHLGRVMGMIGLTLVMIWVLMGFFWAVRNCTGPHIMPCARPGSVEVAPCLGISCNFP